MTVIDLVTRVDAICKKYDRYDVDKLRENHVSNVAGDDAFARLYAAVESDLVQAQQKSETAVAEKSRASAVAMNAEVRRTKARLLEEIPKLQRLAVKKVKGLQKEELEARSDLVTALKEKIEAVSDGLNTSAKQTSGWTSSSSYTGIKFDSTSAELSQIMTRHELVKETHNCGNFDNEYFWETEESSKFKEEYEMRKMKQDEGLDVIAEGLDTLKNMAGDINEEFDRQEPLMDEIDDKVDKATSDLKSTNVRLKDTVTRLRSSRNFCIDIILLCIILGIAAYLYNVLK